MDLNDKTKITSSILVDNTHVTDTKLIAEKLNEHFASVCTSAATVNQPVSNLNDLKFEIPPISSDFVSRMISKLPINMPLLA